MCDESGLIQVRSRELKLRLLDKTIIAKDKIMIQLVNTGLPILLVICFGIIQGIIRKRKYAR
jgi:ABC-2 type transport system permease protein